MKKYITIDDPLTELTWKIRKDYFGCTMPFLKLFNLSYTGSFSRIDSMLRRLFFIMLFLSLGIIAVAPDINEIIIYNQQPIRPYTKLMYAIGMVETMGNTLAYNEFEIAVGIFQIRQVRVDDYNRLTGSKYRLEDMFDYELSKKVFLFFASQIGPYNFEKIARAWNGSGPMTEFYWERIKDYL